MQRACFGAPRSWSFAWLRKARLPNLFGSTLPKTFVSLPQQVFLIARRQHSNFISAGFPVVVLVGFAAGRLLFLHGICTTFECCLKVGNPDSQHVFCFFFYLSCMCFHCIFPIETHVWWIFHGRRKFRSQTSDNMDRWKAEQGRGREKRKIRRKKSRKKRKSKKKEDADARKGRKVAKHCVFPMIWGSGGSKCRLAKAAGAEPAGQMRDEKLHAVVARSTFRSEHVQSTPRSNHCWKLRCRKSARHCGAKHISKPKC